MSKNYVKEYKGYKVPEGATHYNESINCFYGEFDGVWLIRHANRKYSEEGWSAITHQHMQEAAIELPPEPTQEWVDGLPPIGCECDATWLELPDGGGNDFCKVMIRGFYGDEVWFSKIHGVDGYSEVVKITNCKFRPLKTQEQKDREAFIEKGLESYDNCEAKLFVDYVKLLLGRMFDDGFKAPEGE